LPRDLRSEGRARIEIKLKEDAKFGTLYIANDGHPFSESNFNSLSQLGQATKIPKNQLEIKVSDFAAFSRLPLNQKYIHAVIRTAHFLMGSVSGFFLQKYAA
jgi:hypothetical protein